MKSKPLIGLVGVVAAVFSFTELNDQVTQIALPDISGGPGISQDPASWILAVYETGLVVGMCTGPTLGVAFSVRYFLLFTIGMTCLAGLVAPMGDSLSLVYGLRFFQGLGEGFVISNLLAVALRVLDPPIRLYGLALYVMTATFIPNLATMVAALWVDVVGSWQFVFWQSIPGRRLRPDDLAWNGPGSPPVRSSEEVRLERRP